MTELEKRPMGFDLKHLFVCNDSGNCSSSSDQISCILLDAATTKAARARDRPPERILFRTVPAADGVNLASKVIAVDEDSANGVDF